jgi:hypothetical protein
MLLMTMGTRRFGKSGPDRMAMGRVLKLPVRLALFAWVGKSLV